MATYDYSGYLWPSFVTTALIALLAIYGWRHRGIPGARPFTLACLFAVAWSAGALLQAAAVDLEMKIVWLRFETLWQLPLVTAATCFVLEYARDGREAAEQARRLRPDVMLMDIRMPEWDGLAATRVIKAEMPEVKVIVLTTSSESEDLFEAVKSGATGYLLKNMDAESLIDALHDAEQDIPPPDRRGRDVAG